VRRTPWGPKGEPDVPAVAEPQPDQAWKALSVTNEWIRHADTKTGVTLAFVGATVAALFNIVKDEDKWTCVLTLAVGLCAFALVCSAGFACAALFPRTRGLLPNGEEADEDAVNLLFFGDIAGHYTKDRPTYLQVLSLLTSDPTRLTRQVAAQIHENAHIATTKFKYVNRAIIAELVAFGVAAAVAVIATTGW
jgi:hypothetical protein